MQGESSCAALPAPFSSPASALPRSSHSVGPAARSELAPDRAWAWTGNAGRQGMDAGAATGGSFGDASSPNAGHAGSAGMRNGPPTGAAGATATCTFTAASSTSSRIPTVGVVTFTTSMANPTAAHIDFGLDTTYGMTAPVNMTQPSYRTLLLGMKASKTYHFRVVATNGGTPSCTGADNTIMTGALPNGLLLAQVDGHHQATRAAHFTAASSSPKSVPGWRPHLQRAGVHHRCRR